MACIDQHSNSGLPSVTSMRMLRVSSPTSGDRLSCDRLCPFPLLYAAGRMPAVPRAEKHETRHQIEHLEDAWRSAVLKGNFTAMDALLADDYIAITPTGILQSKEQALANLRSGNMFTSSQSNSTDRKIRLYQNDSAGYNARRSLRRFGAGWRESQGATGTRASMSRDARGAWLLSASKLARSGSRVCRQLKPKPRMFLRIHAEDPPRPFPLK